MNREDIIDGTVTLTLDNDEELECEVVSIFEAGDREYISLLPLGGEEEENGEVFIYRFKLSEDGEPDLENIEDDAEILILLRLLRRFHQIPSYQEPRQRHLQPFRIPHHPLYSQDQVRRPRRA